jgi:hypothetical protein
MTDQETLRQAGKARVELEATGGLMEAMEAALFERWAATGIDAAAHREKLYHAAAALRGVRRALHEAVQAGEVVKHSAAMADLLAPSPGR